MVPVATFAAAPPAWTVAVAVVHVLDGHLVTLDMYPAAGSLRGAALVGSLRAGGAFGAPVERVMLVGFSAGGLSNVLAADTPGVVGFVGLDPFDRAMPGEAEKLGLGAAARLRTEVLLPRAPPSSCNAQAVAAPWSTELPALWRDELIPGASHCDFESPSDWLCRLACGETDPARQQRVRQGLLDAAARWMR